MSATDPRCRPRPHPVAASRPAPRRAAGATPALAFAAVLLSSCGPRAGGSDLQMPPTPVEIARVEPQTVRDRFQALGSIDSDEIVRVVSELSAVVVELPFREGQAVQRGALLARLDDREFRAAEVRAAAERDRARLAHERAQKLIAQSAISEQDLDDARTALQVAEANYTLARARLDKTRIRAPFGGLVGRRRVSPGAYLSAGDLITELARVDEMRATFSAPERYLGVIQLGIPVSVRTPAYPDFTFTGHLTVVDPIVDPQTRTLQLVARIPNPGHRLRPGMSADVQVIFAERQKALTVPDEAVFAEGNQSFVYRVLPDSNIVARVAVELGTRDSARVEVLRGLEAGALVIRAGHQKLFDGARVMPVPAGEAGGSAAGAAGPAAGASDR